MTAEFVIYAVIGFVAQLVDGTIGMAYGVVSTTALLSAGVPPLNTTANIHFAELITGPPRVIIILVGLAVVIASGLPLVR